MSSFFSSWRTTGTETQSSGPQDGSDVATTATAPTASTAQTEQYSIDVDIIDLHRLQLEERKHTLDEQIKALSDLSGWTAEKLQSNFTRSRIQGIVWYQQTICDSVTYRNDRYVDRLREEGSEKTLRVADRWEKAATDLKEKLRELKKLSNEVLAVMDRHREAGDDFCSSASGQTRG